MDISPCPASRICTRRDFMRLGVGAFGLTLTGFRFATTYSKRIGLPNSVMVEESNMLHDRRSPILVLGVMLLFAASACGQDKPYNGPACNRNLDNYFTKEVWPKVGAALCLQCHKKG